LLEDAFLRLVCRDFAGHQTVLEISLVGSFRVGVNSHF